MEDKLIAPLFAVSIHGTRDLEEIKKIDRDVQRQINREMHRIIARRREQFGSYSIAMVRK